MKEKETSVKGASKSASNQTNSSNPVRTIDFKLPELQEFLEAGVHFGHRSSRWHPKMSQYIYTEKDGIHVIDLVKTMELLEKSLNVIRAASDQGGVLIVGTKGQAAGLVEKVAKEVGAFYINNRWPGGLFSNFQMIKKSIDKLIQMEEQLASGAVGLVKKEQLMLEREVQRLNKLYEGIKFMERLPQIVIVIDSRIEKGAIREAATVGVQTTALVDTNCDPELVTFPIPANDDSIKSISLFLELFGKAIKGGKRTEALMGLRNSHAAQLEKTRAEFEQKVALAKEQEEAERERMKRLRAGLEVVEEKATAAPVKEGAVIRVMEKDHSLVSEETKSVNEVRDLGLSARVEKALIEAGYTKVSDLKKLGKGELSSLKGIGGKAVEEIIAAIK